MRTLISEVLLPASAAVGLLAMLTIPPATAENRVPQPEATASLAAASSGDRSAQQATPSQDRDGPLGEPSKPAIEPRCERVERIGKFAITRCQ